MSYNKNFFHGSYKIFDVGQLLVPQQDGYVQQGVEGGFEILVDQRRPEGQLSRMCSVFLVDDPNLIDACGGHTDAIYKVEPIGNVQQSDLAWYTEAYSLYVDAGDFSHLCQMIDYYWCGIPYHTEAQSCIEYRTESASVLEIFELNVELSEIEDACPVHSISI